MAAEAHDQTFPQQTPKMSKEILSGVWDVYCWFHFYVFKLQDTLHGAPNDVRQTLPSISLQY